MKESLTLSFPSSSTFLRRGLLLICGAYLANICTSYIQNLRQQRHQRKIAAIGQEFLIQRDIRIKSLDIPIPDLPEALIDQVLNASVSELRTLLADGSVTSENLVNIFSNRCQKIGLELYAITEMDYASAILQAKQCDEIIQSYLKPLPSINVKDDLLQQPRTHRSDSTNPQASIVSRFRSDSQSTTATQKSRFRLSSEDSEQAYADPPQTTMMVLSSLPSSLAELFKLRPLLGIPVSIKDTFEMKGYACTTGCIHRKDMICSEDGLILKLIREAGGIPFVRTNVPQLGMSIECMNRLYGRSLNPWDRSRYPGGSSGGEAILLSTRCSPLGLGTDFGGSVRTPACINGISAFKPTNGRVPQKGLGISANTSVGQLVIKTTLGPMAKCVDDLMISMRVLLNSSFVENQAISTRGAYQQVTKLDENLLTDKTKKFKIAYFKSLDYFEACEAQQRAVKMAVEAMVKRGHELVEIDFPFANRLNRIYYQIISSDNNAKYTDILGEEDYVQEYSGLKYYMTQASPLTKHTTMLMLRFLNQHRSADVMEWCKVNRTAEEFMAINGELVKLRDEVICYLENLQIDAIISPGLGVPAFEHGSSPQFILCTIYSLIWNVLNFPSGVVPITTIRLDEQHYHSKTKDKITREINERMKKNTAGLPMGVQVTSYPYKDEVCLNIMEQIEKDIEFYKTTKLPM